MKYRLYLLASDTNAGTNVSAYATEAQRDDTLLLILRGVEPDMGLKVLLAAVPTSHADQRHAAITCAWDYYVEELRPHLDTYCLEDVELDLPTPEGAGATLTAAPCRHTLAATIMAGLLACQHRLVTGEPGETRYQSYARTALAYADALLAPTPA